MRVSSTVEEPVSGGSGGVCGSMLNIHTQQHDSCHSRAAKPLILLVNPVWKTNTGSPDSRSSNCAGCGLN